MNTINNMWPNATKWGSLRGVSKFQKYIIEITAIFCTFWCKTDYSVVFLSKVMKCWTSPCMISFKITWPRFGLSKIVICAYFYGLIKKKMFRNTSPLFFHIFTEKSVCHESSHDCVLHDKDVERIISKMKNFDIGSYFCL